MRTPEFWSLEGETIDGDLIYETSNGCSLKKVKAYATQILKQYGGGHIDIFFEGDTFICDVEV